MGCVAWPNRNQQGEFVEFISRAKGNFRETYKSQNKTRFLRCIGYLNSIKKKLKARFIANSSSCTNTELSKLLTSCLTAVKNMLLSTVKRYMKDLARIYFDQLQI